MIGTLKLYKSRKGLSLVKKRKSSVLIRKGERKNRTKQSDWNVLGYSGEGRVMKTPPIGL